MAEYNYKGRTKQGTIVTGHCSATSKTVAASSLIKRGITPVDISEKSSLFNVDRKININLGSTRMSGKELLMFCRQMHSLLKAGLPIIMAIERLSDTAKDKKAKDTLMSIHQKLLAGQAFSSAVGEHGNIFPTMFISVLKTGEESGCLEETLAQYIRYMDLEVTVKKRIGSIVRYPIMVVFVLLSGMVTVNYFVIPAFKPIFARFDGNLPFATKALLFMSDIFLHHGMAVTFSVVGLIVAWRFWVSTTAGAYQWDYCKIRMPLFGRVFNEILLSRFASCFSMVCRAGVPINQGLELVAKGVGSNYMKRHLLEMREKIEQGESLLMVARKSGIFSQLILQMIAVGEESGTLETMLDQVADYYDREIEFSIEKISELMGPIILIFLSAMVLILALGIFLPMWNMARTGLH